ERLKEHGFPFVLVGTKPGNVFGQPILQALPCHVQIHTVSLYVSPKNQVAWMEGILALKPERVIFNPGTENPELQLALSKAGIAWEESCTLVLLQTGQYAPRR